MDYFFITPECFANLEESGGFLESAEYCGNKYGTLASDLKARMERTETTEDDRQERLAVIRKEISMIPKYDYLIMNGNGMLEKNIELVHNIIKGQKTKTSVNLDAIEKLRKEY